MKPLAQAMALVLTTASLTMGTVTAASAPGGSTISNKVTVTYSDDSGKSYTGESNVIEMTVREVRSATLTSGNGATQEDVAITATEVRSVHSLHNTGNIAETYTLAASNASDDTINGTMAIYLDADNSGDLSQAELDAGTIESLTLAADATASLIVVTTLPTGLTGTDTLHVTLTATDSASNEAASTNDVNITFSDPDNNVTVDIVTMPSGAGSSCNAYAFINKKMSFNEAIAEAQTLRYQGKAGHVVSITSAEENDFVQSVHTKSTTATSAWLGIQRTINGSEFTDKWLKTEENFTYQNWLSTSNPANNFNTLAIMFPTTTPNSGADSGKWYPMYTADNKLFPYTVEFEMGGCPTPKVEVTLTAAKANCDSNTLLTGQTLGDVKLDDMEPGACVMMNVRAANTGVSDAKNISLKQIVADYSSYVTGSIAYCSDNGSGTDCTNFATQTDASDADFGSYDAENGAVVIGGSSKVLPAGHVIQGRYRLKVD